MSSQKQDYLISSERLWLAITSGLKPPPKISLSQWAADYGYLPGDQAGKWRSIPYQDGILDAITDPTTKRVCVKKARRVGYTKILNHTWSFLSHIEPSHTLLVQPTVEDAQGFSKSEVATTIAETPVLTEIFGESKYRDSSNTILRKVATNGAMLTIVGANSPRSFRALTCRAVLFDEINGYPPTAGEEGSQISLGRGRTDWAARPISLCGSTPTLRGFSKIDDEWQESDQRRYFVPCPRCDHFQHLVWANVRWPKGEPEKAHYVCESCDQAIQHKEKFDMVVAGEWRATATPKVEGYVGFHIPAMISYAPAATWAKQAAWFLEAKDRPETLQVFVNQCLGEEWEGAGDSIDENKLHARREFYEVPEAILALTCGVDVQKDRLEALVIGWGLGRESWVLEHAVFWGDPAQDAVWKEILVYLHRDWARDDGISLKINGACIDSGGAHTQEVYKFCARRRGEGIFCIKGVSGPRPIAGPPSPISYGRRKREVELYSLGVDTAKALLYQRLNIDEPGPSFMHFSMAHELPFFEQLASEVLVPRYTSGRPKHVWEVIPGRRNEALDMAVYALSALEILGFDDKRLQERQELMSYAPTLSRPMAPVAAKAAAAHRKRSRSRFIGR
ncbi:MAG: phage terminase large subunit family protein [Gammaproteobacteria bacterium]